MYRIFSALKAWLAGFAVAAPPSDPLDRMTPGELADLPVHHPKPCVG